MRIRASFLHWIPAVAWMGVIFLFSTDLFAAAETASIFERILHFLIPALSPAAVDVLHILFRKGAHVTAYAVLSLFYTFGLLRSFHPAGLWSWKIGRWALLFSFLYALSDEYHQSFSTVRTASLGDVGWDLLGALAATAWVAKSRSLRGGVWIGFLLLLGGTMLPLLADQLIYFPEREYAVTPDDLGLPFEEVPILAADGVTTHSWWVGNPKLKRTVLFFHGNAGNISHRLDRIQELGDVPARFFLLDYRGYGKSAGKPTEEGLYKDAEAAYQHLRETLEPSEIVLFGESLGGAVAVELALRHPVRGVVLESTFTSLKELAALHYPFVPSVLVPDSYRSLEKISRMKAPVHIFHGTDDEIVPFEMGRKLFEAAHEPKTFHPVRGASHNDVYAVGGDAYRQEVLSALLE